ncbi:MAG TPA: hypothetical protein VLE91_05095 [Candidatus Saccharimonadales bacterium]|nr:hypothetical protein [Candidatus Saccharimonadales bacterium]
MKERLDFMTGTDRARFHHAVITKNNASDPPHVTGELYPHTRAGRKQAEEHALELAGTTWLEFTVDEGGYMAVYIEYGQPYEDGETSGNPYSNAGFVPVRSGLIHGFNDGAEHH